MLAPANLGKSGVRAVIQDFAGPLDGPRCQEVQPHAPFGLLHSLGIHPMAAQFTCCGLPKTVVGDHAHHAGFVPKTGQ